MSPVTTQSMFRKVVDLREYIEGASITVNLKKVVQTLGDLETDLQAEILNVDGPTERGIAQISATPDCVYALCEDGTLWGYAQDAEWVQIKGVPAASGATA